LEEKRKLIFVEREKEAYSWKQSCFSQEVLFSSVDFCALQPLTEMWRRDGKRSCDGVDCKGFYVSNLWNFGGRHPCGSLTRVTKYGRNFLKRVTKPQLLLQIQ
jgi:hypothetical protein